MARRCDITGCREDARFVKRSVQVRLPGHPELVTIGDLHVCATHDRSSGLGARVSIRDSIVASAMLRQR